MWRQLPPAGSPISLYRSRSKHPEFVGYGVRWLASGTAAISLAFSASIRRSQSVSHPEVILPAYGCPDLVAAAIHAGAKPVVVDVSDGDPGFNLESLKSALNGNTVAVVAVNFLGISERLPEIREALRPFPNAQLIEDNAQWYPLGDHQLQGDYVCFSFGRGKPVSLLGGGALLVPEGHERYVSEVRKAPAPSPWSSTVRRIKLAAYNALIHPRCYGAVARLPFLSLGAVVYKPLSIVDEMSPNLLAILDENIRRYRSRDRWVEKEIGAIVDPEESLPYRLKHRVGQLLRFPVLCRDKRQRDARLLALTRAGLGASALYRVPLPEVSGVSDLVRPTMDYPHAAAFAGRLLTLPTHQEVRLKDVRQIAEILARP